MSACTNHNPMLANIIPRSGPGYSCTGQSPPRRGVYCCIYTDLSLNSGHLDACAELPLRHLFAMMWIDKFMKITPLGADHGILLLADILATELLSARMRRC